MEEGDAEAEAEAAQRGAITARMRSQDYAGARALLLQTLQTNPRLDGALEMLPVLEVLCAAGETLAGRGRRGADWYRVLQVLPGDGAARIEARYRSIAAQLEPIGGDLPGAELALRLVREAHAVLSDPVKREGLDSRDVFTRFVRSGVVVAPAPDRTMARSDKLNRLRTKDATRTADFTSNAVSHVQRTTDKSERNSHLSNVASSSRTKRMDPCLGDDADLQSPDDGHVDKKQRSVFEDDVYWASPSQEDLDAHFDDPSDAREDERCSSKQYEYHNFEEDRAIEIFSTGQVWAAYDWERLPRRYALIVKVLMDKMQLYVSWFEPCLQSHEENKWSRAGLPLVCGTFATEERRISLTCPTIFCHQISSENLNQHLEVYPQEGEVWAIYSDWDIEWYTDPGMWKKSAFYIVEILTSYSKESGCTVAHLVKVDGHGSIFQRHLKSGTERLLQVHGDNLLMFSHRIPSFRLTPEVGIMFELEHSAVPENLRQETALACISPLSLSGLHDDTNSFREAAVAQSSNPSTSNMDSGAPWQAVMSCDNKLSPKNFLEGQIWAVFDSRDRMPRSYVRIIRVVSSTSVFVLKLEPHPMLNEEIRWVEDGLPVASGVFRAGAETTYKDVWEFSHPVECDWSAKRSFYRIFPKKGEIWAMYKNWKITLNSTDIDKCEPRMVEILSDYSDESGVNVCSLVRVKGCLTFFHRVVMEDFHLTRWIPRSEVLSFSHRVPAFIVVEIKDLAIPKGSWHLEPSALPTRIIH
jgi:curved DNA-binding protein CbpA